MKNFILVLAFAAFFANRAAAQLDQGDVILYQENGRIATGNINSDTGVVIPDVRVFLSNFGKALNFTDEPGLDTDEGAFPANSRIGFNIRKALRLWQDETFDILPPERLQVRLGPLGPVFTPSADKLVPGFSMPVGSDGVFHHHPGYTLLAPSGDGIYLYEFELWSTVESIGTSRPVYFIFNQNRPEQEQLDAADWVRTHLLCPADFDGDGFITGLDYDAFVFAFEAGDTSADFDGDGFITGLDFDSFVFAFETGCS